LQDVPLLALASINKKVDEQVPQVLISASRVSLLNGEEGVLKVRVFGFCESSRILALQLVQELLGDVLSARHSRLLCLSG
jgi:hypothetical protein